MCSMNLKQWKKIVIDPEKTEAAEKAMNEFWKKVREKGYRASRARMQVTGKYLLCTIFYEVPDQQTASKPYTKTQRIITVDPENPAAGEAAMNHVWEEIRKAGYRPSEVNSYIVDGKEINIIYYDIPDQVPETADTAQNNIQSNDDDDESAGNFDNL